MENKLAVISIIVENGEMVEKINALLHDNAAQIIGRFGLPVRERNLCIISVAIDAPEDQINDLANAASALPGVRTQTTFAA